MPYLTYRNFSKYMQSFNMNLSKPSQIGVGYVLFFSQLWVVVLMQLMSHMMPAMLRVLFISCAGIWLRRVVRQQYRLQTLYCWFDIISLTTVAVLYKDVQLLQSAKCQFDSMSQHISLALRFSNPLNIGSEILALEGWSAHLLVCSKQVCHQNQIKLARVLSSHVLNTPSDADYGAYSSTWLFTL